MTALAERPQTDTRFSEDIMPFTEYRRDLSNCFERICTNHRPIIVTQNGRAKTITFSIEDFEDREAEIAALRARAANNRAVEISRKQFAEGKCISHRDMMREVHEELMLLKEKGLVR